MAIARPADKMRFVQIGDLRRDLHPSIFPCLVSNRRSEPIINLILGTRRLVICRRDDDYRGSHDTTNNCGFSR